VSNGRNGLDKPAEPPRLRADEVQVWRVDACAVVHDCWHLLQPDEIQRARQIRANVARDEFVAGRGVLRWLLAREVGCDPQDVGLSAGAHGKLSIEDAGIEFNVAHSKGVALIALSRVGTVGIDIEHVDRQVEALDVARSSFHTDEVARLEQTVEGERAVAFYRCWTRKEAVVKADGCGLMLPLNSFTVGMDEGSAAEEVVRLGAGSGSHEANETSYYVRDLRVGDGLVAALAFRRPEVRVAIHKFVGFSGLNRGDARSRLQHQASVLHPVTT
jgi:4'-phosphopantetheinyl transferase